jgi:hypothetical protein
VIDQAIRFQADGLSLEGVIAVPEGAARGAVICHPHPQYGGTMENVVVRAIATALNDAGVAILRFNFRGVGASEGRYAGGEGEAHDARAAVAFLLERLGALDIALVGYSFGAVVALAAGHDEAAGVSRLVAVAPPIAMCDLSFLVTCRKPKLFVVGDRDPYCPLPALEQHVATFPEPKALVHLAGADHFFGGQERAVAEAVARFCTVAHAV